MTTTARRIRGAVRVELAGRRGFRVLTTHPLHGELLRGIIRAVGVEPRPLRPVTRWALADQDSHDLGEYVGDYADAEARLLAETSWADEINDEEG